MKKNNGVQFHRTLRAAFSLILALALSFALTANSVWAAGEKKADTKSKAKKQTSYEMQKPRVNADSYVVMSASTSEEIYQVHADRKMPMGNITKLMTAMAVIDNMHDDSEFSNKVTIKEKVTEYGKAFKAGESVSVEDLMRAMLIGGNDEAAEALARYSAGKRSAFIRNMNAKAMEIGLTSTRYSNPSGQYDTNHYSTANESAVVMQYAIRYSKIKEILATDVATVRIYGKKKNRDKTFTGSLQCVMSTLEHPTKRSQYAGVSTIDDMQYVVVILDGKEKSLERDARALFEYGDYKATKNTIVKAGKYMGKVRVKGGNITHVKAYTETKGYAYIPPEGSTDLVQTETVMTKGLKAPLPEGAKVGEYRIYVADELKGTVDLVTKKEIKKGWILSNIYISNLTTALVVIVLLVIGYFYLRIRAEKRRKARIRERKRQEKIREEARKQAALDEDRRRRKWTYSNYYDSKDINDALNKKK